MILVHICFMPSVLDLLKLGFMHHLGIIQTVLIYILFILDLLSVRQSGKRMLMLSLQLSADLRIFCIFLFLLGFTARCYLFVIILIKMSGKISLCLLDQPGNLILVCSLRFLCLYKCFLILPDDRSPLLFCIVFVFLRQGNMRFQCLHLIRTIYTQSIDLFLYLINIFVNRL